jgi:hypothetical protein
MRKFVLLTLILTGAGFHSFAQQLKLGDFSFGLDAAVPVKAESQIFNAAIGGSLQYQYKIRKNLYASAVAGFESFAVIKNLLSPDIPSTYNYVPLKAGLKYYAIWGLYGEALAGESIYLQHGGGSGFDFAPAIGYSFSKGFELSARYEEWKQLPENHIQGTYYPSGPFVKASTFGQFAIRLAVRF